jgi:hypothetical protein
MLGPKEEAKKIGTQVRRMRKLHNSSVFVEGERE